MVIKFVISVIIVVITVKKVLIKHVQPVLHHILE